MAANSQDFIAGFDPTGQVTITAANLLALINAASTFTDKGLTVVTADVASVPDVPDARTGQGNEQWQRYLWIRVQANNALAYVWSPNTTLDATFLYWIPAGTALADGAVTTPKIADLAVTDAKIASVDYGKISGFPSSGFIPGGPAGGDLAGTYPSPSIGDARVVASKIGPEAVTNGKLSGTNGGPPAVDITKNIIIAPFTAKQVVRVNDAATGLTAETKLLNQLAEPTVAEENKLIRFNNAGTAFEYVTQAAIVAAGNASAANTFTSGEIGLGAGLIGNVAHLLGSIPLFVRWVIRCKVIDRGYAVGDEVSVASLRDGAGGLNFAEGASATNVLLAQQSATIQIISKDTQAQQNITAASWKAVCYARL